MDYDCASEIWRQIRTTGLADLRDELVETAIRYARLRVDYLVVHNAQRPGLETERTACHNALIAQCDILARNMAGRGEDASWRSLLGQDRKTIGDFACFLHCLLGLSAR